jgi:hypothetical protein
VLLRAATVSGLAVTACWNVAWNSRVQIFVMTGKTFM